MTEVIYDDVLIEQIQDADAVTEESGEVAVDIVKTQTELSIVVPISGVAKENLSVRINDNVLVISGKRLSPVESSTEASAKAEYLVRECFWGKFNRMIVLPSFADTRHMRATFKHGTLVIAIPILEDKVEKELEITEE